MIKKNKNQSKNELIYKPDTFIKESRENNIYN